MVSLTKSFLSVCIPTRNRLQYLKEMLPPLLAQAELLGVEVCVSDNCSKDETDLFLQEMQISYGILKVIWQQNDLTIDENMAAAMQLGTGDYVYPLGDDDALLNYDLEKIVTALQICPKLLMLNARYVNDDLEEYGESMTKDLSGQEFNEPVLAFTSLAPLKHPSHFSSFVVKRSLIVADSLQRYFGSSHAYIGAIWDELIKNYRAGTPCAIHCMDSPTVRIRWNCDKTWAVQAAQIYLYQVPLWWRLLDTEYSSAARSVFEKYIRSQFRFSQMLIAASEDSLSPDLRNSVRRVLPLKKQVYLELCSRLSPAQSSCILSKYLAVKSFDNRIRGYLKDVFT